MDLQTAFRVIREAVSNQNDVDKEGELLVLTGMERRLVPLPPPSQGQDLQIIVPSTARRKRKLGDALAHTQTRPCGGRSYKFAAILQALFISRLIRRASSLPDILYRSVHYCLGSAVAQTVKDMIDNGFLVIRALARFYFSHSILSRYCFQCFQF